MKTTDSLTAESAKLPVTELAKQTGNVLKMGNRASFLPAEYFSPQHAAAAFMHGWLAHEKATGKTFETTLEEYQLALVAAHSTSVPHSGALSQYAMPIRAGKTDEVTK